MKQALASLVALALTIGTLTAQADERLTDSEVRSRIIQESLATYPGNCPCPYNLDRAGRRCGKRSAWNRAGGQTPICFPDEISDEQVRAWRARN